MEGISRPYDSQGLYVVYRATTGNHSCTIVLQYPLNTSRLPSLRSTDLEEICEDFLLQ